jgi:hypothetical protein
MVSLQTIFKGWFKMFCLLYCYPTMVRYFQIFPGEKVLGEGAEFFQVCGALETKLDGMVLSLFATIH